MSLNICNAGHDDVVYDGAFCPCCTAIDEKNKEIDSLEDNIRALDDELSELNYALDSANERLEEKNV